jgi:transcriptional regulator with XRE-family HTH domain
MNAHNPADPAYTRGADPIDVQVGLRIRARRKDLKMSQEKLAEACDVTFQQIQKYERGANRVSASALYHIARKLQVPVAYFFDGLDEAQAVPFDRSLQIAMQSERIRRIAIRANALGAAQSQALLTIIESMPVAGHA